MLKFILETLIIAYIVLLTSMAVHELGHFYFLRKYKVPVQEFSIGYGLKIFSKGIFTLKLFPLHGYNKYDEEIFNTLSNKQKINIYKVGSITNIIFAVLLLLPLLYFGYTEFLAILIAVNLVSSLNLLPIFKNSDGYYAKKLETA